MTTWLLSEPKVGTEMQCRALADALGLQGVRKCLTTRWPWKFLPARFWPVSLQAAGPGSDSLAPPWPELVISCGRYAVGLAMAIQRASGGKTRTVHIQHPRLSPRNFDLVVAPEHDRLTGANVIVTRGSLIRVTPQRLAADAERFAPQLAHLPRPLVSVLVGGASKTHRFTVTEAANLADQLVQAAKKNGGGIALTVSRRTSAQAARILRHRLSEVPSVMWDGTGENPYFGYLGLADFIVVTCDSINMTCEACATGKPVYVAHRRGGSRKFRTFHRRLEEDGYTKPFDGTLQRWTYPPLNETDRVAAEIRQRFPRAA